MEKLLIDSACEGKVWGGRRINEGNMTENN